MVTHYLSSETTTACGRTGSAVLFSKEQDQVTCKSCQRTLVKAGAPAAVQPRTEAPAATRGRASARKPQAHPSYQVKSAWGQRLAEMPGRNRLPRGGVSQVFI